MVFAVVLELVDKHVSEACPVKRDGGSNPLDGTKA